MARRPDVVALDVLETMIDLQPLGTSFAELGLREIDARLFFAQVLRDAFALEVTRHFRTFEEITIGSFAVLLASRGMTPEPEDIEGIVNQLNDLPAHADVKEGLARLQAGGVRVVALTNGALLGTHTLLERAGLEAYIERIVSIDEVRRWKPSEAVYQHAAKLLEVDVGRIAVVAAHAWDVHGAKEAGLSAAWLKRFEKLYHPAMHKPDVSGDSLPEVAEALLALPA